MMTRQVCENCPEIVSIISLFVSFLRNLLLNSFEKVYVIENSLFIGIEDISCFGLLPPETQPCLSKEQFWKKFNVRNCLPDNITKICSKHLNEQWTSMITMLVMTVEIALQLYKRMLKSYNCWLYNYLGIQLSVL